MDSTPLRETHFLERTAERLDRPEAEFALALWQSPKLLAGVLQLLHLPADVPRVALGLGVGRDGPWLVVTRDGDFVTCLAEGMAPTGLHVVPATQVAAVTARAQHTLAEVAFADERAGESGAPSYGARLVKGTQWISREDYRVYAAWEPALAKTYLETFSGALQGWIDLRQSGRRPKHVDRKSAEQIVRLHWQAHWSMLLTMVLIAHGKAARADPEFILRIVNAVASSHQLAAVLRAIWVLGYLGKPLVPLLKKQLRDTTAPTRQATAHLGLATIALRYRATRAEIEKVLLSAGPTPPTEPEAIKREGTFRASAKRLLHDTAVVTKEFLDTGEGLAVRHGKTLRPEQQAKLAADPALPGRIAGPLLCMSTGSLESSGLANHLVGIAPPWLAAQDAPDLFLAQADMVVVRDPYDAVAARALCDACLGPRGQQVVHAGPQLGRNDPCHCGSGRKFKQCCLDKRVGTEM